MSTITPETLRAVLTRRARPKPTAASGCPWWLPLVAGTVIAVIIDLAMHGPHPYITP